MQQPGQRERRKPVHRGRGYPSEADPAGGQKGVVPGAEDRQGDAQAERGEDCVAEGEADYGGQPPRYYPGAEPYDGTGESNLREVTDRCCGYGYQYL